MRKGNCKLIRYTLVLDLDETLVHYNPDNTDDIKFRPHLEEFLMEMRKHYDMVIFTAAMKDYADIVIDHLENDGKLFSKRLYRDSIKLDTEGENIKDLGLVNDDLSKTIIIDNTPENFLKQKANGIFIKSWYGDPHDNCLLDLVPILKSIVLNEIEDVRLFLDSYKREMIENIRKGCLNPNALRE